MSDINSFLSKIRWDNVGVEPSETQKTNGRAAGDRLPANEYNFLLNNYESIFTLIDQDLDSNKQQGNSNSNAIVELALQNDLLGRISDPVNVRFGTDFTNDINTDSTEISENLVSGANSGQPDVSVAFNNSYSENQQVTLVEGANIEEKIINTLTETSGNDIAYGEKAVYESGTGTRDYHSIKEIDTNKFVIVYKDGGNSGYGEVVIATVSGTSVTFGSIVVFKSESTNEMRVEKIDTDKFIVVYRRNDNYGCAQIGTVSGTTITMGTEYIFNSATTVEIDVALIDTNKVAIVYRDGGNSNYGTAIIGTISGTVISYGSEYVFNSASTNVPSIAKVDTNKFAIAYMDGGNSNYGTAIIGTASGTTISYGSEYVFNSASTTESRIALIDTDKLIVTYKDGGNSLYGTAKIATISGTTISYGSAYVFNSGSTSYMQPVKIDTNRFAISYQDAGNSFYGTAVIGAVSGTVISYGSEYVFNSSGTYYVSIEKTDTNEFIIAFRDDGNGSAGTAIIGSAKNLTITFNTNLANTYTTAAEVIRNDSPVIPNGDTAYIRLPITMLSEQDDMQCLVHVDEGVTINAYASIVDDATDEDYFALTLDETLSLGDGTQELVYSGTAPAAYKNATLKLVIANASGVQKEIYKVLGGLY